MVIIPNSDDPRITDEEESLLESVVHEISAELGESVVARGVRSIEFTTYQNDDGRKVMFEFRPIGTPQVDPGEFQRVLAMRFVQLLWERHGKRCLAMGVDPDDQKFSPWPEGDVDYVLATQPASRAAPDILPTGLTRPVGRNDPCPCGSGRKFKDCCMGRGN